LRKTEIHIKKVEYKGIPKLIDFLKHWRKHIFQKGFTEMRKCEITLLAFDNKNKKIGAIYGGLSIDQDNYDGEIYSLNCEENDKTDSIKTELFNKIIEEFKISDFKSVCVEFYKDAGIKSFYLKKEPEFIEEIINYEKTKRISEVYGWKNITEIKTAYNTVYN
jgi:Mor family transcriptional regulator